MPDFETTQEYVALALAELDRADAQQEREYHVARAQVYATLAVARATMHG